MVAGGYDKKVYHIDPRAAEILKYEVYHTQPVLTLAVDNNFILTGSEDKTVKIYDRRADKVYKTIEVGTNAVIYAFSAPLQHWHLITFN